ncbi:MAG: NAD(P)H-hydrate dehydratase [Flavobacteriales bacterium]|nr:NAD(P)H-hydrate dehydratase [Flavobacteriales bacterium]
MEALTMEREPISSVQLMERAANTCALRILDLLRKGELNSFRRGLVVAGMGNNGGDGLVISRVLQEAGIPVRVVLAKHREEGSPEHVANMRLWREAGGEVLELDASIAGFQVAEDEFVVDALFGTGLSLQPTGWLRALVETINACGNPVVAIDLPSGMTGPGDPFEPEACIHAKWTFTFEVPRMPLLIAETGQYAGNWDLLPIGLDPIALAEAPRLGNWVTTPAIRGMLLPLPRYSHKGTRGHAFVSAGSKGMFGAAVLAVKGALRSGAGLVTAHVPGDLAPLMATTVPDAMTTADPSRTRLSTLPDLDRYDALAIGPGLGQEQDSKEMIRKCLMVKNIPMVLDADALNIIAADPGLLRSIPLGAVLTPHPKEMDRLLGTASRSGFERLERARTFAQEHACTVVLKGAYTCTCTPAGDLYFNSTGNAGLAKGGSGDVLTGLLVGQIAQGYPVEDAAIIAAFVHGLAGDITRDELGMDGMRPSDLVERIPSAWMRLRASE